MGENIRDVMTPKPVTMSATSSVADAARAMRDRNIGDVIVLENGRVSGIVTDRDIVVRALAAGRDLHATQVGDICSREPTTLAPTGSVEEAIQLMREKAIRRLPVVEQGKPIGIVSLGDLAVVRDRRSVLGDISAAPPNH